MSNAIEAIEARIRANRDDAEAWKVYADALLDRGDPRGELILLELQPGAVRDPALRQRLAALKRLERAGWEPAKRSLFSLDWEWLHGFVVGVTCGSIIGANTFYEIGQLLADPQSRLLGRLELKFDRTRGSRFFDPLADLDFGRLRWFVASRFHKGDQLVRALVRQPTLGLVRLDLESAGLTDEGLVELVACARLRSLRRLSVSSNAFGLEGIRALADASSLSELEELDLRYNGIDVGGATALALSPHLRRITSLWLDVDEAGAHALSSAFSPISPFCWRARS